MMYLLLVVGFVLLIKGADFFVEGSSSVAKILKVPSVVIGLTIVAMGTSAPEAAVSIMAGVAGNSDLSLGNIVGSNIFNLFVVIGFSAIVFPFMANTEIMRRDIWWNIAISALLLFTMMDGRISRTDGVILLLGMLLYLFMVISSAIKNRAMDGQEQNLPLWKSLLYIILGLATIILGGNMVVTNASRIASALGMSDTLIGLTIVAIGTSLPELATSFVAAKKGDSGIALGNAVGSCLFNIMFILGITSVLSPIHASPELFIDTIVLIVTAVIILVFARSKREFNRIEGGVCVGLYLIYTLYIIVRNYM